MLTGVVDVKGVSYKKSLALADEDDVVCVKHGLKWLSIVTSGLP